MALDFRILANPAINQITPYQPGKPIEELERELGIKSAIKLASNENPLGASPHAIDAIKQFLKEVHIYPDGSYYALKHALAKFLNIATDCITVGNGSENILELIVKSYLKETDNAVISEYAFLTIPILIKSYGVSLRVAKAKNYGHDVRAMVNCVDEKTRVVFLVNPNNPTGTYTSTEDFLFLMETLPKTTLVVVDEAYIEYINQNDYPNVLAYLTRFPNLVVTRTFSKAYGLAGLRLGYAISSLEIADILNRARLPFNVNSVVAKAAIAAIHDQAHVTATVNLNKNSLMQLEEGIKKLGLAYIPSVGNFLTIDVHDGEKVYQQLLNEGVIVRPLRAYNMPQHIRVSTGTEDQNERFLIALSRCLQEDR